MNLISTMFMCIILLLMGGMQVRSQIDGVEHIQSFLFKNTVMVGFNAIEVEPSHPSQPSQPLLLSQPSQPSHFISRNIEFGCFIPESTPLNAGTVNDCEIQTTSANLNSFKYDEGECIGYSFWASNFSDAFNHPNNATTLFVAETALGSYSGQSELELIPPVLQTHTISSTNPITVDLTFEGNVDFIEQIEWLNHSLSIKECDLPDATTKSVSCICEACSQSLCSSHIDLTLTYKVCGREVEILPFEPVDLGLIPPVIQTQNITSTNPVTVDLIFEGDIDVIEQIEFYDNTTRIIKECDLPDATTKSVSCICEECVQSTCAFVPISLRYKVCDLEVDINVPVLAVCQLDAEVGTLKYFNSHAQYGTEPYPYNPVFLWAITAPPGMNVKIVFVDFEVEAYDLCTYDGVEVYSGNDEQGHFHGQFCSTVNELPPAEIISQGDSLFVKFYMDDVDFFGGFSISYEAVYDQ